MSKWVALIMHSEWHEDGIDYAIGPFDTKEDAENAIPEDGYSVELKQQVNKNPQT